MIDFNLVKDVLWEFIKDETGAEIIFANQSNERPTKLYGTLQLITGPILEGMDEERNTTSGDIAKIETVGQRQMTLSVNFYRAGALNLGALFQKKCQSRNFREKLRMKAFERGLELTIFNCTTMQDLTSLLQSDYEERSQLDVFLRLTDSLVEDIATIGTIQVEAGVVTVANEVVDDGTFEIEE
jgi:hypothetical protein